MTLENKLANIIIVIVYNYKKRYFQEVGLSYHPQLRDSLEAAGYEGQFLQKVMMMLVVTMHSDDDVRKTERSRCCPGAWHAGGGGYLLEETGERTIPAEKNKRFFCKI